MRERYTLVPITATVRFILPAGSIRAVCRRGRRVYLSWLEKDPVADLAARTDSDTVLGLHVGLGATLKPPHRFTAGLDARYIFVTGHYFNDSPLLLEGMRVAATFGTRF